MARRLVTLGAVVALLSVGLGAFGAHALATRVDARALHSWDTAARYQMFHAFALIVTGWVSERWPGRASKIAATAFVVGLVLFCGSLYALALGSPRAFGAVAPLGGLSFMTGWGALAFAAAKGGHDNV